MTATPEQLRQASDPATPGATLGELAAAHPDLHTAIALNPATYPGLLDWLRQYGAPEVQAALARRAPAPPPPPSGPPAPPYPVAPQVAYSSPGYAVASPRVPFVEPTRMAPLTWGTYETRYNYALAAVGLAAVLYIVSLLLVFSDAYSPLWELGDRSGNYSVAYTVRTLVALLPLVAYAAALIVIPARDSPRLIALGLTAVAALVTFGQWADWSWQYDMRFMSVFIFASIVAAWFVARERPARSFAILPVLLVPALVDAFAFYDYYGPLWLGFVLLFLAFLVGSAWVGRALAASAPTPPPTLG